MNSGKIVAGGRDGTGRVDGQRLYKILADLKSFKCCQTYVVQLEKSILRRCDTKCCHTNVAADPTIIECDEDVMLWGKMFDCNWVIIGLDLGVGDLF